MKDFPPEKCTACGACVNACPVNAVSWKKGAHQIEIPFIDASACISCGKCGKVCPQNTDFQGKYPLECYAAWLKDASELEKSSSGGAARAFSRAILAQGGIVFGCVFRDGKARHVAVRDPEGLDHLSGSKYVWSDTCRTFSEAKSVLEEGRPVLYIGTPCQIDGLKHYLGNVQYENLFLVDLICHGVPPAAYINEYVEKTFGGKPREVSFRNRDGAILSGVLESGKTFKQTTSGSFSDPYMEAYISGLIYRENCHTCRYANPERVSDITIGDFWGIRPNLIPEDAPELKSVIFINTENGKKLLEKSSDQLEQIPYMVLEGVFGKDNVKRPQARSRKKDYFYEQLERHGFVGALESYREKNITSPLKLHNRIMGKINRMLGRFAAAQCQKHRSRWEKNNSESKVLVQITTIDESFILNNYGTVFQHYALRKFLSSHGFAVCRRVWEADAYKGDDESYIWWRHALFCKTKLKHLVLLCLARFNLYPGVSFYVIYSSLIRPLLFRTFYTKHIGPWREKLDREPDFSLAGGDQVFAFSEIDSLYFRLLVNQNPKYAKISYSASANWDIASSSEIWKKNIGDVLWQYRAVGVREKAGQKLIQDLCHETEVFVTVDPVLLLTQTDYLSIVSPKRYFKKPTLLCYLLHCSQKDIQLETLKRIAQRLNVDLKIIGIQGSESSVPAKYGIHPSPTDFLRAVRDAKYVITNSFHGTVFSVIFEKQWVTIPQKNDMNASQNARQIEFLETIGLQKRFVSYDFVKVTDSITENIPWKEILAKISDLRKESKFWLLNNLRTGNENE